MDKYIGRLLDNRYEILEIIGTGKIEKSSAMDEYKNHVTALVINDGITEIGANMFESYPAKGDLELPDSVTAIGNSAFRACGFDGTLTLSNNLQVIPDYAFQDCNNFKGNLVIPDNVTTI